VTLLYVAVDPGTRRVRFASAGQTPGIVVGADGGLRRLLAATGPALGLFASGRWESRDGLSLAPGDVVVLSTDGATECPGRNGATFDDDGVLEVVRAHRHESAHAILDHLVASLRSFSGGEPPRDDITLVVCKAEPAV
jgi:sigma-B regulation protein RsbU (phosphoserine phosphatase)